MADTKISALSAGTAAPGDEIPVNRSGSNFKITAGDILKINGGTITADSPVLNLTQTWNNAAVTFTGLKFNATDTNSADDSKILSLSLDNNNIFTVRSLRLAGTQYYRNIISATQYSYYESVAASGFFAVGQTASLATLTIYTGGLGGGLKFRSGASLSWGTDAADASSGTTDLFLFREAAGTLAQRNAANAQTFRIYNNYTDATNTFERGKIAWESDVLRIGTEKGVVGGTARALELQTDGTTRLTIGTTGVATFTDNVVVAAGKSFYDAHTRAVIGAARGNGGVGINNVGQLSWCDNASALSGTTDLALFRDAAGTLAQRNGANAQESRVYGSYTSATNYQRTSVKTVRESSGALSGASYTTTIAVPAYANLIGVTTRVTTDITGATTYDVGDGSDVDLWGAAIGITAGTASSTADFTAVGAVGAAAASRTITLTANGSNFTGGEVEICAHYLFTEAD